MSVTHLPEDARQAADVVFQILKLNDEDYWQEFLIALHDQLANEFLEPEIFSVGRYLSDLERRTVHTVLTGYAAQYASHGNIPELEECSDAADSGVHDFGACPVCQTSYGYLNIHRDHWFFCDEHKVRWLVGSNLFSSWEHESEAKWKRNERRLQQYTVVKPWYPNTPTP